MCALLIRYIVICVMCRSVYKLNSFDIFCEYFGRSFNAIHLSVMSVKIGSDWNDCVINKLFRFVAFMIIMNLCYLKPVIDNLHSQKMAIERNIEIECGCWSDWKCISTTVYWAYCAYMPFSQTHAIKFFVVPFRSRFTWPI